MTNTITAAADNLPLWHGTNNANAHDTISQVKLFEQACGATLYPLEQVPPLDKLKLRLSLELEELYEKAQAMGLEGEFQEMLLNKSQAYASSPDGWAELRLHSIARKDYDPVALLDACCDQRYVQDGTMLTCGLDAPFPEAFAEVQRSNMSKFPYSALRASIDQRSYAERGIGVEASKTTDTHYVLCRADGKIMKSTAYSPANLVPIIAKYTA